MVLSPNNEDVAERHWRRLLSRTPQLPRPLADLVREASNRPSLRRLVPVLTLNRLTFLLPYDDQLTEIGLCALLSCKGDYKFVTRCREVTSHEDATAVIDAVAAAMPAPLPTPEREAEQEWLHLIRRRHWPPDLEEATRRLVLAASERPGLRSLYPFTSLYALCFSRTTRYPWDTLGAVAASTKVDGRYEAFLGDRSASLFRKGAPTCSGDLVSVLENLTTAIGTRIVLCFASPARRRTPEARRTPCPDCGVLYNSGAASCSVCGALVASSTAVLIPKR